MSEDPRLDADPQSASSDAQSASSDASRDVTTAVDDDGTPGVSIVDGALGADAVGGEGMHVAAARGLFVTFEGGDGAGKTTQIERAAAWLREAGHEVVITREPGGTPLGVEIRQLLLHGDDVAPRAEALLYAADRAHHIETLVRPALARGAVVLQDRYIDSSIAYQGAGRALDADDVERISQWATGGLTPEVTVLIDVSPEVARERRGERGAEDRLEREADDFHTRVREHFLRLAARDEARYLVLDAGLTRDELARAVRTRLEQCLTASTGTGPTDTADLGDAAQSADMANAAITAGTTNRAGAANTANTANAAVDEATSVTNPDVAARHE